MVLWGVGECVECDDPLNQMDGGHKENLRDFEEENMR